MVDGVRNAQEATVPVRPDFGPFFGPQHKETRPAEYIGRVLRVVVSTSQMVVRTSHIVFRIYRVGTETLRELFEGIKEAFTGPYIDSTPSSDFSLTGSPDSVNPNAYHKEISSPKWNFTPYVSKPRRCKMAPKVAHLPRKHPLRLPGKVFKALHADKTSAPLETTLLGAKITNDKNSCYIDSIVQALRFCKPFRERLRDKSLTGNPVVKELRKIYNILEGRGKQKKRALTGEEISNFRNTLIRAGMVIARPQGYASNALFTEDAGMVLDNIFAAVGLTDFTFMVLKNHNFPVPLNSLKPKNDSGNQFAFGLDPQHMAARESIEIQDLFQNYPNLVDLEPPVAKNYLKELKAEILPHELTPEIEKEFAEYQRIIDEKDVQIKALQKEKLDELEAKGLLTPDATKEIRRAYRSLPIATTETTLFFENQIPPIFPIVIKRAQTANVEQSFVDKRVKVSDPLDIKLADKPGFAARFKPVSFICYNRSPQVSAKGPAQLDVQPEAPTEKPRLLQHYRALVQYHHKDQPVYAEFDDLKEPLVHRDAALPIDDIERNATIYIYQFEGIVPA